MRALGLVLCALVPVALPMACTGLESGEIVIVDEDAGGPGAGGTGGGVSGSAGKGKGGAAGSNASAGRGGASGGTGDAGEAGTGPAGGAGSSNGGGANGGSSNGATGGTGNAPTDCSDGNDCATDLPICDTGTCRACTSSSECAARDESSPVCHKTSGACVECLKSSDCGGSRPVCDDRVCRRCEEGSECVSGACNSGRCADESQVVYALAGTGSYDADCGTHDKPCISLQAAAEQLTSARPFLVMLATNLVFSGSVTIPPMLDVTVFGNHVTVNAYNYDPPEPAFTIAGGTVTLDDIVIEQDGEPAGGQPTAAVLCTGGTLKARRLSVTNTDTSYGAAGLRLVDCDADVQQSAFIGNVRGLDSSSSLPLPAQALTVERSLFKSNREALQFQGDHFLVRNNLFVENGLTSYVRIVRPIAYGGSGIQSYFAYNTLYGNHNQCSYEGGLIACEGGETECGVLTSNITWNNMYALAGLTACPDQVYVGAPTHTYSIAETTWPGTGNSSSDPLFADPSMDDFTPGAASPAIDAGNPDPNIVPAVDYYGNPRPVSDGPDIGAIEASP